MATSSIFHNFRFTTKESSERFVDALEKAEKIGPWKPRKDVDCKDLRDPEEIGALMAKWEARQQAKKENAGI